MKTIRFGFSVSKVLVIVMATACAATPALSSPTQEQRRQQLLALDKNTSPEAMQRKERSEQVLVAEGVPINKSLPAIATEKEAMRRTREQVAYRALALLVVAGKGAGIEQATVEKTALRYGLDRHFTPEERAFFRNPAPSRHDKVQFSWRIEAAYPLLWALGYVDKLSKPEGTCDVAQVLKLMSERTAKEFVADAKLRPIGEMLDQADRIYRYRWAVVEARVNGKKAPAGIDAGVAQERHHALNWLVGYMDQEWDDISTDT